MSEVARGAVKQRPISLGRRIESYSEADYHTRVANHRAASMMAADANRVISMINDSDADDVTKLNLINQLTNYGRNVK